MSSRGRWIKVEKKGGMKCLRIKRNERCFRLCISTKRSYPLARAKSFRSSPEANFQVNLMATRSQRGIAQHTEECGRRNLGVSHYEYPVRVPGYGPVARTDCAVKSPN